MKMVNFSPRKDTSWSIVILVACCVGNFLGVGLAYSSGVYYVEFLETFKATPSAVSLISSINLGCTLWYVSHYNNWASWQFFGFVDDIRWFRKSKEVVGFYVEVPCYNF